MFAHIAMVFQLYDANVSSDLDICCKDFDLHVAVLDGVTGDCCCRSGVQPWFSVCGAQGGYGVQFPATDALLLGVQPWFSSCGALGGYRLRFLLRTRCCWRLGCNRGFLFAGAHGWVWGAGPCYGRRRKCSDDMQRTKYEARCGRGNSVVVGAVSGRDIPSGAMCTD